MGGRDVLERAGGAIHEEDGEHAAENGDNGGNAGGARARFDIGREAGRAGIQFVVGETFPQGPERRQPGGDGHGVAAERAGLIDGAEGREKVHQFGAAGHRAHRQAAPDDLAETEKVGTDVRNAEGGAGAAVTKPKGGDDLVPNQQRAAGVRQFAQPPEKGRIGQEQAHVGGGGFEKDGRKVAAMSFHDAFHLLRRVEAGDHGLGGVRGRNAGGGGLGEAGDAAAGAHQQAVGMAMVTAAELQHEVPSGGAAGNAKGAHAGLGAGADEADLLGRGNGLAQGFGHLDFGGGGDLETGAAGGGIGYGANHLGRRMAEDQRSEREAKTSRRRPSSVISQGPSARAAKIGSPPTERNERTGLLTPPGMATRARSASVGGRAPAFTEPSGAQ